MALDFNLSPPAWMTHEIDHIRTIGDEATKTLTTGVALGSALLHQKEQREALATNALEQQRTQQDMEDIPVWAAQHPNPSLDDINSLQTHSRWGQQAQGAIWMRSYQQQQVDVKKAAAQARADYEDGMVNNGSEQAKIDLDISKKFTDGIISIPIETDEAAAEVKRILLMPRGPGGGPTPEAITALGKLKAKYPPATKPGAETNEIKNAKYIKSLRAAGDTETADLIENILKARGHLGTGEPLAGKFSDPDKVRSNQAQKELDRVDAAISKLDPASKRYKDEKNRLMQDKFNAQAQLDGILKKYDSGKLSGSKPITAPSVKDSIPKAKTQAQMDEAIQQANEAIKAGADPDAVKKRLKDMGISLKD